MTALLAFVLVSTFPLDDPFFTVQTGGVRSPLAPDVPACGTKPAEPDEPRAARARIERIEPLERIEPVEAVERVERHVVVLPHNHDEELSGEQARGPVTTAAKGMTFEAKARNADDCPVSAGLSRTS
jgi:hypothetical protein